MCIRKAHIEDIEKIAEIYVYNWKKTYKALLPETFLNSITIPAKIHYWREYINKPCHFVFVYTDNSNNIYGFVALKEEKEIPNCLYLDSLHIKNSCQGKGIGSKLISFALSFSKDNHYSKLSICIVNGNDNAKNLYKKLGAKHYKFFDDDFVGTISHSEKLLWDKLY